MINRLTDALDFQSQALTLRAERQRLIASNIANADTPGYVARDMDFASALRQATGSLAAPVSVNGLAGSGQMAATQPGHIQPAAGALSESGLRYATAAQTNLDRNTVDMDRERASFAENSVKYEATLRFLNAQIKSIGDAMKSPSQG
jgi:flagellar basal-body rod protein FlgB